MRVGAQAHGRGVGFSPDRICHTHPQRAAEKQRERGRGLSLLLFTLWRRAPERLVSRCVNGLVLDRKP